MKSKWFLAAAFIMVYAFHSGQACAEEKKLGVEAYIDRLEKCCGLTQEQADAVRPIFEEHEREFQQIVQKYAQLSVPARAAYDIDALNRLNAEMHKEIEKSNMGYHEKLGQVLTSEQMIEWRKFARQRLRSFMRAIGFGSQGYPSN